MKVFLLFLTIIGQIFSLNNAIYSELSEKSPDIYKKSGLISIENSPTEVITNTRSFLNEFNDIKNEILSVKERIENSKYNSELINNLRILQEILIEISHDIENIEKLVNYYEKLIDIFVTERLSRISIDDPVNKVDLNYIKNILIDIYFLDEENKNLENQLLKINNEKIEQENSLHKKSEAISNVSNENASEKNYSKRILKEINKYKLKLNRCIVKRKDLEIKIIEIKKLILKDSLRYLKNLLNKIKNNYKIDENTINYLINNSKENKKLLFEQKDEKLNKIDSIDNKISSICENLKINCSEIDSEKIIFLMNETLGKYDKSSTKFADYISILEKITEKNLIYTEILAINNEIFSINRDLDFISIWNLIKSTHPSPKDLKKFSEEINSSIIKDNLINLEAEKTKLINLSQLLIQFINIIKSKSNNTEFNNNLISINEIEKTINNNIELQNKIINKIKVDLAFASSIEEELKAKNFWCRSQYSIDLKQMVNFFPDIKKFCINIKNGFVPFITESFLFLTLQNKNLPSIYLMHMLFGIFISVIIGLFFNSIFLYFHSYLIRASLFSSLATRIDILLNFFINHAIILYSWFSIFSLLKLRLIPSDYALSIYCLFSIPFFWFLIYSFMKWFIEINKQKSFIFIASNYIDRFSIIINIFLYSNSFLYLFREAFLKSGPQGSMVITLIYALQFILLQITVISLIRKDKILKLISENNRFTSRLKNLLNDYYQIFLFLIITIIIMSNPYVGYGRQVLYVLSRTIITLILLPIFNRIFEFIKENLVYIFFETENGEIKNRISAAKTIYTIINAIFLFLIYSLALILLLKFYEFDITIEKINYILNKNLIFSVYSSSDLSYISIINIGKVFIFLCFGYVISYIINIFFILKILNTAIVGHTVQNTIITLSRYTIVFCMFLIGLYSNGLQGVTTKVVFIIGFIGFAIKEPIADFLSYFIILVQRPIKIGDLVQVGVYGSNESDVIGIIRQITPRTTLIRQRNSQTVIIPNSIIISKLIINWNYLKNSFIATDDILITVDFNSDPELVKSILLKAVESHSFVLKNPLPTVRLENIIVTGYQFLIRPYISTDRTLDRWEIASQIRISIIKKLKEENIKISIPRYKIINESDE